MWQIQQFRMVTSSTIKANVSVRCFSNFLHAKELQNLVQYAWQHIKQILMENVVLSIKDVEITWMKRMSSLCSRISI